ncbi:phosphatase PAP2 family protein [Pseudacidovorax sp. RU35E]|uniref:phosphatase PAP2 family protein n=1 Tax=Pseudacidovorax sp. RU35E TaxID=1907403 RepID=UPI000953F457|nr:phosphatase PAP2 family protein [Pseudacidovorax sp. RU35E]SIQ77723.1 PAP2 superfamily protein [Pseudacidovorax sp. RU35E]
MNAFLNWHALTWLGDSSLMIPMAVAITAWLGWARRTRPVMWLWLLCLGAAGAVVVAGKFAFMGWGVGIEALDFTGFSGHTTMSTTLWPVALWLMVSGFAHRWRVSAACAGWALGAAIGGSRLALDAHSMSEVVSGFLLGLAASGFFLWRQRRKPHPKLRLLPVLLTLALPALVIPPGTRAPTHELIGRVAAWTAGNERPFVRADLHAGTRPAKRGAA